MNLVKIQPNLLGEGGGMMLWSWFKETTVARAARQ